MVEINDLVTITLDKERHLRLTLGGMIAFEKRTGKNLLKGFKLADFTMEDNAALIWVCLIHEDKSLKFDSILDMVDIDSMTPIMAAVLKCLTRDLPEEKVVNRPLVGKHPHG